MGELDKNDNLIKTFIYASKSHVPDYFIDQNNVRYKIIVDQLGSVRLIVNAKTGEIVQKMLHDEFGKILTDTKPGYTPFGFAGGLYDPETKLVRFGVRDYDPRAGRWTSKDPIRFEAEDSNIYGYVFNDPVNLIDLNGKNAFPAIGIIAVGFGIYYLHDILLPPFPHPRRDPGAPQPVNINDLPNKCTPPTNHRTPKGPLPPEFIPGRIIS